MQSPKILPKFSIPTVAFLLVLVSACTAKPAPTPIPPSTPVVVEPTVEVMQATIAPPDALPATPETALQATPTTADDHAMPSETAPASVEVVTPAWFALSMQDVRTGEQFTLNDLKGKTILLETMAIWCPNCKSQQNEVKTLHESLANPDLLSITLDIDPNENAESLKQYATQNDFVGYYVVATPELAREISNLYGAQFINPPSAPMLLIDAQGVVHPLSFGVKPANDLLDFVKMYLPGM